MHLKVLICLLFVYCIGVESCSRGASKVVRKGKKIVTKSNFKICSGLILNLVNRLNDWLITESTEYELRNRLTRLAQRSSAIRPSGRHQFGFVVATATPGIPLELTAAGAERVTSSNGVYPASRNSYNNFIAARNYQQTPRSRYTHVEHRLLNEEFPHLRERYLDIHGETPNFITLYSYYAPCDNCTNTIIDFHRRRPNIELYVAYSDVYGKGGNATHNLQLLQQAGIKVMHVPLSSDDFLKRKKRATACGIESRLQGCLVEKLTESNTCCFPYESDKTEFINKLVAECYPGFTKECLGEQAKDCSCVNDFSISLENVFANCHTALISNPLSISDPSSDPGMMWCPNCLQTPPESRSLGQPTACRHKGDNCTATAGNSVCRNNHYCGLHGESYNWCYIDGNNNWDYCCKSSCKKDGSSYMWCEAGKRFLVTKYPYCGDSGMKTIKGTNCANDHPCGSHGYHYHWCYLGDTNGGRTDDWEYCCRPDHKCARRGEDYEWCYVGRYYKYRKCQ